MLKNNRNGLIALMLVIALFLSFGTLFISANEDLAASSRAAVLYEPQTKTFLYSKNENERLPMASTTKIMTALVAIERENLDKIITVDKRATGVEGSSAYLKEGETFTLRELLYALMLQSANDAAEAIAYDVAGSIEAFADMMNDKALNLGLRDTHFTNPHGLDDEEHYTTAHDLAIIAAEALESSEFRDIVSSKIKKVEKDGICRTFVNHNKLLNRYDGSIGVKTGFTKKSGRCLVGAAERNGLKFITVTINSPDDWNEHERMLDYGFDTLENEVLLSRAKFNYSLPILNSDKEELKLAITEDITAIRTKDADEPKMEIQLPKFATTPIKAGECVGRVVFKDGDKTIAEGEIVAAENAESNEKNGFLSNIIDFFRK